MSKSKKGLFNKPYTEDNAFMLWVVLTFLTVVARIVENVNSGGFNLDSSASIISGILDGLIGTLSAGLFIWIFMLPYLLYRKKNLTKLQNKKNEKT